MHNRDCCTAYALRAVTNPCECCDWRLVRSEGHSSKVVEHITDIIAACIEDMQSVSVRMLDCLLYRLVAQEDDVGALHTRIVASGVAAVLRLVLTSLLCARRARRPSRTVTPLTATQLAQRLS